LGHLPHIQEAIRCDAWVFTVTQIDGRRFDKVNAHPSDYLCFDISTKIRVIFLWIF